MRKKFSIVIAELFAFLFLLLIMPACQREIEGGVINNDPAIVNDDVMIAASVRGTVIDENNQPVAGAAITSGSSTTTTDKYGVFRFNNINLSKANGYIKIVKPGYFTGMRTFVSTAGRIHNVRIKLLPKTNTGTFVASAGGTITLSSGGKMTLPANAVTDATGTAYSGTVNVAMTWINPAATDLSEIVVGDLRGITASGEERGLATYGMLGVEMTTPGGQALKIASGKTAELTFPIPGSLAGTAPATIDLWHFDEVKGRWIEEGAATKTGSNYIAQVSHFSFWNCDAPYPLVDLCMTIVNAANNQPLNNVPVRIKRTDGSYGSGWTDSAGNLCGKVPKNEALVLQVLDQCYTVAYSQTIGPFSADASLGTIGITLPSSNTLTITGTVTNCAGNNVTNGAAVIYSTGAYSYTVPVTNGAFSVTILRCSSSSVNFSVLGVDYAALQQSVPVSGTGTSGTVNTGTIQACGTSSAQFIEYIIDGTPYNFAAPPDMIICYDSAGTWGTYSNRTTVSASSTINNISGTGGLTFLNDAIAGTYPLTRVYIYKSMTVQSEVIITPNPTVNITAFGPSGGGGFIEGNFNLQMMFGTTPKNVLGSFRVRRN